MIGDTITVVVKVTDKRDRKGSSKAADDRVQPARQVVIDGNAVVKRTGAVAWPLRTSSRHRDDGPWRCADLNLIQMGAP